MIHTPRPPRPVSLAELITLGYLSENDVSPDGHVDESRRCRAEQQFLQNRHCKGASESGRTTTVSCRKGVRKTTLPPHTTENQPRSPRLWRSSTSWAFTRRRIRQSLTLITETGRHHSNFGRNLAHEGDALGISGCKGTQFGILWRSIYQQHTFRMSLTDFSRPCIWESSRLPPTPPQPN